MPTVPLYRLVQENPASEALLGNKARVYAFGRAPQGVEKPYVVWQEITGDPGNTLSCKPGYDQFSIQIDVYAATEASAEQVWIYLRDILEDQLSVTITAIYGGSFERETTLNRFSFAVSWFVKR